MTAGKDAAGSFVLEEAGLRCVVTLTTDGGGHVGGAFVLGHLRFTLRGQQDARGALRGVLLGAGGWPVARWRATLHGEQLRLELCLPESVAAQP